MADYAGPISGVPEPAPKLPATVQEYSLDNFDMGVFAFELLRVKVVPKSLSLVVDTTVEENAPVDLPKTDVPNANHTGLGVTEGTYQGTKMALTAIFNLIEQR